MKQPNVILISIDTLRADHLSCYGYHRTTTPNLDQMVHEGVIFENAYSTASWTPPAHASMLTGLYPSYHGAVDNNRLGRNVTTIAEIFQKSGYKTVGFVNNSQVGELVGLEKGHETFIEVWKGTKSKNTIERGTRYLFRKTKEIVGISDHGAHKTNLLIKQWLGETGQRPFYMFIHYIEPHNPINPPFPFKNKYWDHKNNRNIDKEKLHLVAHNPLICFTHNIKLNQEEIDVLKALYDGEISYMDHKIGELIEFLKKEQIYDETLIVITADHGEHFGEHDLYSHVASLYEPIIHIPLIIKYPKRFNKRARISGLVQLVDICPTIVESVGLDEKFLKDFQGRSLFSTDDSKYHDYIIAEWEGRIPDFVLKRINNPGVDTIAEKFREPMTMIREDNYKYILGSNNREELYDLEIDNNEINNLIDEKKEIGERLKQKLIQWKSVQKKVEFEKQSLIDEVTKKNLESLGYM